MESSNEFTVRITGTSPPPIATKKSKRQNTASAPTQQRFNLRLSSSTTLNRLQADVFSLFNVPASNRKAYRMEFLSGFPPIVLDQNGKNNVGELGIRSSENVIVKITLISSDDNASATQSEKAGKISLISQETSAAISGRPKRAAAEAASSSFKDTIKAQNAMMKKERKNPSSSAHNVGNTLKKVNPPKKIKMEGVGYRLSDSQAFPGSPVKKGTKQNNSKQASDEPLFRSKDDIATTLLSSLGNKSIGGGNVGKFLRAAMKGALTKSYEASKAQVRVSAVENRDYEFGKIKGGSIVDGGVVLGTSNDDTNDMVRNDILGTSMYQVSYGKGMEGRGKFVEQVEIIGVDALKAVIETVYKSESVSDEANDEIEEKGKSEGREMLRPASIAQMSPRIFWSLVYHYNRDEEKRSSDVSHTLSVEDMLKSLMPQLDWSHLDRGGRKRVLSEKAKENLRQEKRATSKHSTANNDFEAGVRALEEIDDIVLQRMNEKRGDPGQQQGRNATMNYVDKVQSTTVDDWDLVTQDEEDENELTECILYGRVSEDSLSDCCSEEMARTYSSMIMSTSEQPCCINLRELADVNSKALHCKLTRQCKQLRKQPPSLDTVKNWIDEAQKQSLEEIMLEILDGDEDVLDLLQEKARSSSPRDLANWQSFPNMLLETMECSQYSEQDVLRWISRAQVALRSCPWLEDFTTPVL
ncbi:hypothetical protein HJC23_010892 [Cyclotella cryptica]|uniref:Uncharacterized protein n=1 Tax=Cyclotella cryptica TaxID=29204 RepID=A0ABD3NTD9_9STRA